ncbi:MAG: transglutaminase-like domain-containing protein [Prevotellaceae bacterium]|jgi:hypothetical protein|nr:transglutaminase-like domain-containing protein [Prevotellaceae bacterium]
MDNTTYQPKSYSRMLWRLIFLCLPTIAFMLLMLQSADAYYAVLQTQHIRYTIYFALGILSSCALFSGRMRFIPITLILLLLLYIIHLLLDNFTIGEFDSFFLSVRFKLFYIVFILGWICGWGFARLRYFPIILSFLLILVNLTFVSKVVEINFEKILLSFAPILLFSFYIIYMAEAIRNIENRKRSWLYFLKRLVAFSAIMVLLLGLSSLLLTGAFREVEKEWGNSGKSSDDSLLSRNQDSTFNVKESLQPRETFNSGKGDPIPVLVAYIDNFLEGVNGELIPNPLYLTANHLPKFDTFTETFERDSIVPYDDLFKPDPSKIPLYFTETDSMVLVNAMSDQFRKVVTTDVYKIQLAPNEFVSPTTAFFCQPISVEKDFKSEFSSAYRTQSYVSELNSAYFVYPSRDLNMQRFQMRRFNILDMAGDYSAVPKDFYDYYTEMPTGSYFDSILSLAKEITMYSETVADKLLAIRDFFMAKDDYGEAVFKYSENPGIPGIPSASKLAYFLFESHTGYCAHYAGAALFLLRANGIPSRVTVGFATVDRSSKNPGWYWFYEDQAHAWVQVYFPEYGWLDFDFTMGNEDMEEAPTADGTPPTQPQKAYFAGKGTVTAVDTIRKQLSLNLKRMIYHDREYSYEYDQPILLDMRVATIEKDSLMLKLSQVNKGDSALAISFAEALAELPPSPEQSAMEVISMLPHLIPTDELHIDGKEKKKPEDFFHQDKQQPGYHLSLKSMALILLIAFIALILALLATPTVIFRHYKSRAFGKKSFETKTFYSYRAAMFLLNQLGCTRDDLTPLEFAKIKVDPTYGTDFTSFMVVYLRLKYAGKPLNEQEKKLVQSFYKEFEVKVKVSYKFGYRFRRFLNFYTAIKEVSKVQ